MSSDDDKNFADAFPRAWFYAVPIAAAILIVSALSGCDNGESRRQQNERIEKQIYKIERERGR